MRDEEDGEGREGGGSYVQIYKGILMVEFGFFWNLKKMK